jgi:hypothetical protein
LKRTLLLSERSLLNVGRQNFFFSLLLSLGLLLFTLASCCGGGICLSGFLLIELGLFLGFLSFTFHYFEVRVRVKFIIAIPKGRSYIMRV